MTATRVPVVADNQTNWNRKTADAIRRLQSSSSGSSASVTPEDMGYMSGNARSFLQAAFDTGEDVRLKPGVTYPFDADIFPRNNFQSAGGPGILAPTGDCGIVVTDGLVGCELDLAFSSSTHTGTAIKVDNAARTRIHRLNGIDVCNLLYFREVNDLDIGYLWGTATGYGILGVGDDTHRSDIVHFHHAVISCGAGHYAVEMDGNINTVEADYLGMSGPTDHSGGKGALIHRTSGTNAPQIMRLRMDVDYPVGVGIEIVEGLAIELKPDVNSPTLDCVKIGALVNNYQVRIPTGRLNGAVSGYGINNGGGVCLAGTSTEITGNSAGQTNGNVWEMGRRFALDGDAYWTLSGGDPIFVTGPNMYLRGNRSGSAWEFYVGGVLKFTIDATGGH